MFYPPPPNILNFVKGSLCFKYMADTRLNEQTMNEMWQNWKLLLIVFRCWANKKSIFFWPVGETWKWQLNIVLQFPGLNKISRRIFLKEVPLIFLNWRFSQWPVLELYCCNILQKIVNKEMNGLYWRYLCPWASALLFSGDEMLSNGTDYRLTEKSSLFLP